MFKSYMKVSRSVRLLLLVAVVIAVAGMVTPVSAQQVVMIGPGAETVDAVTQGKIIDSVCRALEDIYVFPDVAKKMEDLIRKQYKNKAYQDVTNYMEFTDRLTEDLRSISHDRHLAVRYNPNQALRLMEEDSMTTAQHQQMIDEMAYTNYDWYKLERLPGNIGYVDFRGFRDAELAGPTAIAAMNFLSNCDAIIFDLRQNGGGSPSMIQLITSYFVGPDVHLNSFYIRQSDSTKQFWTLPYVPGPQMRDVDLYVLTSSYTFSAAEEFTYNLKNLKRATIVGETTGGGAHPTQLLNFPELKVSVSVPYGRAINPISGTNWEGTGIEPDIKTTAAEALDVAQLDALTRLASKETNPGRKTTLEWAKEAMNVKLHPTTLTPEEMAEYVGSYGPRVITIDGSELIYQRGEAPKKKLIALGNDRFMLEDTPYFRVQFKRDDSGRVMEIEGQYDNGQMDAHRRNP